MAAKGEGEMVVTEGETRCGGKLTGRGREVGSDGKREGGYMGKKGRRTSMVVAWQIVMVPICGRD